MPVGHMHITVKTMLVKTVGIMPLLTVLAWGVAMHMSMIMPNIQ